MMRKSLTLSSGLFVFVLLLLNCSRPEDNPDNPTPGNKPNEKSSAKDIIEKPQIVGLADYSIEYDAPLRTYSFMLPVGGNEKSLKLTVKISPKASIAPDPNVERDYSSPVTYTVTA